MIKIENQIKEIEDGLNKENNNRRQQFINFRSGEFEILVEASRTFEKPKGRTIAIACRILLESLKKGDKKNKTEKDGAK